MSISKVRDELLDNGCVFFNGRRIFEEEIGRRAVRDDPNQLDIDVVVQEYHAAFATMAEKLKIFTS